MKIKRSFIRVAKLIRKTITAWLDDNGPQLGAALAFYTVFSLAPTLVIAIAVAGSMFGQDIAELRIMTEIRDLIGFEGAKAIQGMIDSVRHRNSGTIATIVGVTTLVVGATAVFVELQKALNNVWRVKTTKESTFTKLVKARLLSFTIVLGLGFLLLVSLIVSALIAAFQGYVFSSVDESATALEVINNIVSFVIITVLFAALFKFVPDTFVRWRDVWLGAAVTAFLFTIGKFAIGLYLGKSGIASIYGAAGSLVVIMLWVYYSAQIMLLGAEFTKISAQKNTSNNKGNRFLMKEMAVHIEK